MPKGSLRNTKVNFDKSSESIMPRPYNEDLRLGGGGGGGNFPDYLSALSRTLLRFFWTTFVETAVYSSSQLRTQLTQL